MISQVRGNVRGLLNSLFLRITKLLKLNQERYKCMFKRCFEQSDCRQSQKMRKCVPDLFDIRVVNSWSLIYGNNILRYIVFCAIFETQVHLYFSIRPTEHPRGTAGPKLAESGRATHSNSALRVE